MNLDPSPLLHSSSVRSLSSNRKKAVFDLSERKFYRGFDDRDMSVRFHGRQASTPLGPAAGPHTQMAQNIALSYLGGSRILELKTVQVLDRLSIPRPCIDMATVGYNVEWSQEFEVPQSAREYAKAWFLIAALRALGIPSGMLEKKRTCSLISAWDTIWRGSARPR